MRFKHVAVLSPAPFNVANDPGKPVPEALVSDDASRPGIDGRWRRCNDHNAMMAVPKWVRDRQRRDRDCAD